MRADELPGACLRVGIELFFHRLQPLRIVLGAFDLIVVSRDPDSLEAAVFPFHQLGGLETD